ncbi:MAG: MGH1-like glycoside hydrolase domain-containing protein, partial [Bacteroidota bacterium]
MKKYLLFLLIAFFCFNCRQEKSENPSITPEQKYADLKTSLVEGWNIWDNRSILTHVHLPEGLGVLISLKDGDSQQVLEHAFTGNRVPGTEKVQTIAHTPGGAYTDHKLHWKSIDIRTQSVKKGDDLYIRIINQNRADEKDSLKIRHDFIYQSGGKTSIGMDIIQSELKAKVFRSSFIGENPVRNPENTLTVSLKDTIYIITGESINKEKIDEMIENSLKEYQAKMAEFGDYSESWNAIQNAINWTVVYDPDKNRAVIPVSRPWSYGWGNGKPGGWVQFCWDNFFVAYMQAMESKNLAYNEAIQMCNYIDEIGFVPNYAGPGGIASRDRSQPPVGSMMIKEIYKMHPEKWFLEKTFDQLLTWNRWWKDNRDQDGYLSWGSNPFKSESGDRRELTQNNFKAASNESGLDNTPMYDGVPFDTTIHMLKIADVGLMGLYIGDCEALADIARVLGREEAEELEERADYYRKNLKTLWNEDFGLFLNKRTDTDEFSYRISPTNFYALIGKAATQKQAERMINEH